MLLIFFENMTAIITFIFLYNKIKSLLINKKVSQFCLVSTMYILTTVLTISTMMNPFTHLGYNFDLRSTYLNTEMMLVIKSAELTQELVNNMEELQYNSRRVISETEYEVPGHIVVEEVSVLKTIALKVVGFVAQAFRFLL